MADSDTVFPDEFTQFMGQEWIGRLPARLADCERRWTLKAGPPFPNRSYHYVAPVVRADGSAAVLKIGVPSSEFQWQIDALRFYTGNGSVRLLEADGDAGAMLLERLEPGVLLSTLTENGEDEKATSIAAGVMRRLWRPAPPGHGFPTVADWSQGLERLQRRFDGGTGPFPAELVEAAERLFAELIASTTDAVLLHGDVHHFNILSAERAPWLAIDPQGVVGDPAFEIGPFLHNPSPQSVEVLARRLDQLSEELDLDRERARGWALAQGVLSAWWCMEDGVDCWVEGIDYCERLRATTRK